MYRYAESRLRQWLAQGKSALLIHGARQVGKTWLIREVLQQTETDFFEINLLERPDILSQIKQIQEAGALEKHLALYSPRPLEPGSSVIFLDEIQVYPEILTVIKFLADAGQYRYILSGSNLGIELKGLRSMPVGYVDQWQMYPMNLFEFSLALGAGKETLAHIEECFRLLRPVDPVIHQQMLRAFYYYLMTGGMPGVVSAFLEKQNLQSVYTEQQNLINQYKADFIKYEAENRRLKIISVFDSIPSQLNKQNRRFVFTYLNKELKFDRYEESFLWLKDASVAIPVYNAQEPVVPLEQSKASNLFKLFQNDVGLLTSCYPLQLRQDIMQMEPEVSVHLGAVFENYVAEELYAAGQKVLYYKSAKIGEIDFLTEMDGSVLPIEVKSGRDYRTHKALDNLLFSKDYAIESAVVLSPNNVDTVGRIRYLPVYMAPLLHSVEPKAERVDIRIFS